MSEGYLADQVGVGLEQEGSAVQQVSQAQVW